MSKCIRPFPVRRWVFLFAAIVALEWTSRVLAVESAVVPSVPAYATPAHPANARGLEQSGVFPAHGLVCDLDEHTNVLWKTPLPNFGMNAPVVAGGLVFVLCDPGWTNDAPVLLAVDAATGAIRWQVEVDNLDAPQWTEAQRTEGKRLRADEYRFWRRLREADWEWSQAKDEALKAAVVSAAAKDGLELSATGFHFAKGHPREAGLRRLADQGWFGHPGWYDRATFYTGQTMPSAVCDGKRVYVYTALNALACFDLQGRRLWLNDARFPQCKLKIVTASPVLSHGVLVAFAQRGSNLAVGYDALTGAERWRHTPTDTSRGSGYAPGSTPVPLDLGGTPALYLTSGYVLRLSDGVVLGRLQHPRPDLTKATHFGNYGCSVGRGDRLYVNHGEYGSPAPGVFAFRLGLDGDRLTSELLWSVVSSRGKVGSYQHLILDGDRIIAADQGKVLDTANGNVLAEIPSLGISDPGPILADGKLISLRRYTCDRKHIAKGITRPSGCDVRFFDARTYGQIGAGFLEIDPPNEAKQRQCVAITGDGTWGWGGGGFNGQQCNTSPVADGNRLYLRSNDNLYCIGLKRQ